MIAFFAENVRIWDEVSTLTLDDARRRFASMPDQRSWPASKVLEQPLIERIPTRV